MHKNLLRKVNKYVPARFISRVSAPILVTSYGRSGSGLLYRTLKDSVARYAVLSNRIGLSINSLDHDFKKGFVYHSHSFPRVQFPSPAPRIIYIYSNPLQAVFSTYHAAFMGDWWDRHCAAFGLQPPFPDPRCLFERDLFDFKGHFESWLRLQSAEVLFVKYESLWSHISRVEEYVGCKIDLPIQKQRKTKQSEIRNTERIEATYCDLIRMVRRMPPVLLVNER